MQKDNVSYMMTGLVGIAIFVIIGVLIWSSSHSPQDATNFIPTITQGTSRGSSGGEPVTSPTISTTQNVYIPNPTVTNFPINTTPTADILPGNNPQTSPTPK